LKRERARKRENIIGTYDLYERLLVKGCREGNINELSIIVQVSRRIPLFPTLCYRKVFINKTNVYISLG